MEHDWLRGVGDYAQIGAAAPVPATSEHRQLRRVQAKSSPERLRRRQMRRHGLTLEEAVDRVPDSAAGRLRLPFLQISSASTKQTFRLYIRLEPKAVAPVRGAFNTYGLSATATIPWF